MQQILTVDLILISVKSDKEKENYTENSSNHEKTSSENNQAAEPGLILSPAHLNGSLKIPVTENSDNQETSKTETAIIEKHKHSLWKWPAGRGKFTQATWILTWPIHLVFMFTIPDCERPRFKKWFPLTFIMCIVWIGSLSYVVAWMITIIGAVLFKHFKCSILIW